MFTARYALSPYITHICLVLTRLNSINQTVFVMETRCVFYGEEKILKLFWANFEPEKVYYAKAGLSNTQPNRSLYAVLSLTFVQLQRGPARLSIKKDFSFKCFSSRALRLKQGLISMDGNVHIRQQRNNSAVRFPIPYL